MSSLRSFIERLARKTRVTSLEEIYLSQATSLEEVERRQREIQRGDAPWQKQFRN